MSRIRPLAIAVALAIAGLAAFSPTVFAQGDGEHACRAAQTEVERRAARAAVDALGGGTALCVEREQGRTVRWEVEVRRDGWRYEVELDSALRVVDQDRDDDRDDDDRDDDDRDDDDRDDDDRDDDDRDDDD